MDVSREAWIDSGRGRVSRRRRGPCVGVVPSRSALALYSKVAIRTGTHQLCLTRGCLVPAGSLCLATVTCVSAATTVFSLNPCSHSTLRSGFTVLGRVTRVHCFEPKP
jgi:hypothetical protein